MTVDKVIVKRTALSLALAVGLAGSFYAGIAYAADARLDDANAHIVKADALLKAASNPNLKHHPFGGHRVRAERLLKRAEREIALAKKYADNPRHKDHAKPKGKAKGHGEHHGGKARGHGAHHGGKAKGKKDDDGR